MKRIACAALLVTAALLLTASGSQGATVAYSFTTNTGYTGAGELSYDAATAPLVIIESGSGQTTSLRSLSLAIFSPSSALLDSGSAVIESVSSSPYLGFTYDIATLALSLMDNNTTSSGNDVSYFVSNYVVAAVVEPHLTEPGVARLEHSLLQQAVAVKRDVVGGEFKLFNPSVCSHLPLHGPWKS